MTHYEMTLEEHRAARGGRYVDPGRYREGHRDYQPEMICLTGDGHAVGTRDWNKVTCDRCLERKPQPSYHDMKRETHEELAVAVRRSPMGGGWIWGTTERGKAVLAEYYGEGPAPIAPMGGWPAYIVEPNEASDLAEYLLKEGIAWHIVR